MILTGTKNQPAIESVISNSQLVLGNTLRIGGTDNVRRRSVRLVVQIFQSLIHFLPAPNQSHYLEYIALSDHGHVMKIARFKLMINLDRKGTRIESQLFQ